MTAPDRHTAIALWALTATAFFAPLSTVAAYLCLVVLVVATVSRRHWRSDLQTLRKHPLALVTMALIAWITLSMVWSEATNKQLRGQWGRYLQMLVVPITLILLNRPGVSAQTWRKVWLGFAAAMTLTVLLTWIDALGPIHLPWDQERLLPPGFKHYIIQGCFTALLVAACVSFAWDKRPAPDPGVSGSEGSGLYRRMALCGGQLSAPIQGVLILLAMASAWSVAYILPGKTGLLALIAALLPATLTLGATRFRPALVALLASVCVFLALMPGTGRDHLLTTIETLQDPNQWDRPTAEGIFELADRQASTLARAKFAITAWRIGVDHPVIGAGSGAYRGEFCRRTSPDWCQVSESSSAQPHNQFLLLFAEQGAVGLGLFLAWCLTVYLLTRSLGPTHRYLALASLSVFIVHSLLDGTLRLQTEGLTYPLLLAAVVGHTRGVLPRPESRSVSTV